MCFNTVVKNVGEVESTFLCQVSAADASQATFTAGGSVNTEVFLQPANTVTVQSIVTPAVAGAATSPPNVACSPVSPLELEHALAHRSDTAAHVDLPCVAVPIDVDVQEGWSPDLLTLGDHHGSRGLEELVSRQGRRRAARRPTRSPGPRRSFDPLSNMRARTSFGPRITKR